MGCQSVACDELHHHQCRHRPTLFLTQSSVEARGKSECIGQVDLQAPDLPASPIGAFVGNQVCRGMWPSGSNTKAPLRSHTLPTTTPKRCVLHIPLAVVSAPQTCWIYQVVVQRRHAVPNAIRQACQGPARRVSRQMPKRNMCAHVWDTTVQQAQHNPEGGRPAPR